MTTSTDAAPPRPAARRGGASGPTSSSWASARTASAGRYGGSGYATKREASDAMQEELERLRAGGGTAARKLTVGEFLEQQWLPG